ncbi:MAG: hypothetical protein OSJ22_02475 [Rikenellaceae bacterium]|nr:hypothetical protein [Rikenellaceae bacterium]
MNLKEQINSQLLIFLRGMEDGEVFRVDDFNAVHRFNASQLSRVLSVMVEQGIVVKLSKGVYAKGSGDGKPLHPEDMIRDCIFDNTGGRVGYLTGHSYLVSAGLVKDYRDKIAVAVAKKRGDISRGGMTFRFVEQPLPINDQTYELLQMLDALRGINRVGAEVSSDAVYEHVKANIKLMSPARVDRMTGLALGYPHMVRALLGSIVDTTHGIVSASRLMISLNCTTVTPVNLSPDVLHNAGPWRLSYKVKKQ